MTSPPCAPPFRPQVWEETAAQHVSLRSELGAIAALATRWRRLELASWRSLLQRVVAKHAEAAAANWCVVWLPRAYRAGLPPAGLSCCAPPAACCPQARLLGALSGVQRALN